MSTKMDMQVAVISSLTGGLGHYCAHLSKPLSKHCNVRYITYPQQDLSGSVVNLITDSFVAQYIRWPKFMIDEANPKSIVDIYKYLKKKDTKIVNIHVATTVKKKITYFTTLISYFKKLNGIRFVFTLHDVFPFDEDRELTDLLRMFYGLADHFTVGNMTERKKLEKYFHIPSEMITTIPHGIYDLFNHNLYGKKVARSLLGIPQDKKVILFFGWLREYKGFEYLVRATEILRKKRDDFIVYVASGTKYASPELIDRNLQLIHKLNLDDQFMLNLNYLNTSEVEAVFKSSNMVVLPYTHASQSGVMMMAFGFKRPVIISDCFHDKKWVNKKAGLVAHSKDPVHLAEKITYMLNNPKLMEQYGIYGYEYSTKHFNWTEIAKKYFDMYMQTVNQ